jgi:hypothetical protein
MINLLLKGWIQLARQLVMTTIGKPKDDVKSNIEKLNY